MSTYRLLQDMEENDDDETPQESGCCARRGTGRRLYWGWVVMFSFFTVDTIAIGLIFSFAETVVPLSQQTNSSIALLNFAGSMQGSMAFMLAPIATIIHTFFSVRTFVFAGILIAATTMIVSASIQVDVLAMLFGIAVVNGPAIMIIFNVPYYLLNEYFPYAHPRHVLATSFVACSFPTGRMIFNAVTGQILQVASWRVVFYMLGGVVAFFGSTAASLMKTPSVHDMEEVSKHKYIEIKDGDNRKGTGDVKVTKFGIVLLGSMWQIVSTLKSTGYYAPQLILVQVLTTQGIPQSQASWSLVLFGGCELFSRLMASFIGDRFKGKLLRMYVVVCALLSLLNIAGAFATTYTTLMLFAAAMGLLGGPVIAAMFATCYEVMNGLYVHELFSVFRTGLGTGLLLGPMIGGLFYDYTGSFQGNFIFAATIFGTASILYVIIILLNHYKPRCLFAPV